MDRRVKRTKDLIWNSFVKLTLVEGYENVSIKDILEDANIGRSTFYSHYESKENLLFSGQMHLLTHLFENIKDSNTQTFKPILEHAKDNAKLAKVLLSSVDDKVISHIQVFIADKFKEIINYDFYITNLKNRIRFNSVIYAVSNLILEWIKSDCVVSIPDIEEIIEYHIHSLSIHQQ